MRALDREILRLALPSILANLTVPLVGMVDIAIAGHLDTSAAALIGGISVGALMFDLLYWNFGFLRAGTGGMTAQAYGRGDPAGCATNLRRGVHTGVLLSLLLLLVQWPFEQLIFLFIHCSEEVRTLAVTYFRIRIWAAPATLSLMAIRGWFVGMQDSFSSMLTDIVINGSNILVSLFLALGIPRTPFHGIGYTGIAWGTVIAQYAGLLLAAAILFRKYHGILQQKSKKEDFPIRTYFKVNGDLFIRSLCLMTVYLAYTALAARQGDLLLAMCSVMMKLMMIFSYFTDGFAFAGEALTGRFTGSREPHRIAQVTGRTFLWSMGIGLVFVGIYAFSGIPLFRMMTSDDAVVEAARAYIPWLALIPLLGCPAFTWDGIYIGATATRVLRNATLGCVAAFFITWWIGGCFFPRDGASRVHLLFAAYYAHLLYRSLFQTLRYKRAVIGR
ncbi:MAG: MATE family efflux transporter [Bacteroidales bacterium]|nr:MATE family efflux transporter [Bacteroidales bacterium]